MDDTYRLYLLDECGELLDIVRGQFDGRPSRETICHKILLSSKKAKTDPEKSPLVLVTKAIHEEKERERTLTHLIKQGVQTRSHFCNWLSIKTKVNTGTINSMLHREDIILPDWLQPRKYKPRKSKQPPVITPVQEPNKVITSLKTIKDYTIKELLDMDEVGEIQITLRKANVQDG